MKVLLSGGGTGGHITPILAVAQELKQLQPNTEVIYVGERYGKFGQLTEGHIAIDAAYSVFAGKFRRYYGESWFVRLTSIKTNLLNLRDALQVLVGTVQAWWLLGKLHPDVVFLKGGYVGVPIGLAAAARHIPIVTHDSDAFRGLANRLVSRWAAIHATALPADYYPYPRAKVISVGVLVEPNYQFVSPTLQADYKHQLGLPAKSLVLLITGGSSGAEQLNKVVAALIKELLDSWPTLQVIHQVGKGKAAAYKDYNHERLRVIEFMKPMYVYTGAADLIVTRAGANAIAEFGIQGKACIIVPSPHLTGGHQLKNAALLKEQGAALVVQEEELYKTQQVLLSVINNLLAEQPVRKQLADKLHKITLPNAAQTLAKLLLDRTKYTS